MIADEMRRQKIILVAISAQLLEGEAMQQLESVSRLPGVEKVTGLPDLHPGKGIPVGAVFITGDVIYPHLIGNDIGCGMALWKTGLSIRKIKLTKLEKDVTGLENFATRAEKELLDTRNVAQSSFDRSLGTIGGGNHFAELQAIEEVKDEILFAKHSLDADQAFLLVHSGSRGLGESILQLHLRIFGATGLSANSEEAHSYVMKHDHAVRWACVNRELIARRFARFLGGEIKCALDLPHNFLSYQEIAGKNVWIHRKGATCSLHELMIIPGSRGSLSYLVTPMGNQEQNTYSLSHGAGRKWRRSECRKRLSHRFDKSSLLRTHLGGRIICEDLDLLYEEAPQAYKNIETVIESLEKAQLLRVVATLRPLLTYKIRRPS